MSIYSLIEGDHQEVELQQCAQSEKIDFQQAFCAHKLAIIYNSKGLKEEALEYFYIAHEIDHENLDYIYDLALAYNQAQDYLKAKLLLQKYLLNPANNLNKKATCAYTLGFIYNNAKLGQIFIKEAIKYYLIAYNIDPTNSKYIYAIASAYYFNRDYENAAPYLKQGAHANLTNIEKGICANKLAHIYEKEDRIKESLEYFEIARELDLEYPQHTYDLALAYYKLEEYQKAESFLAQCVDNQIIHGFSDNHRATCASKLGTIYEKGYLGEEYANEAVEHHLLAYKIKPNNPIYLYKLAIIYHHVGEYKIAKPLLIQCTKANITYEFNDSHKASCANWLGLIYLKEEPTITDINQAIKNYLLAHKLAPQQPTYLYNLALTYQHYTNDYKQAEMLLKQCTNSTIRNEFTTVEQASCANKLANIYYKGVLGKVDVEQAIKYHLLAYETNPNKIIYAYNLAMTYYYAEKYLEAKSFLKLCVDDVSTSITYDMHLSCHAKLLGLTLP